MQKIILQDIRIYAYHGVFPEEHTMGAYYKIGIEITTDFTKAMLHDSLSGTINYGAVYQIVQREMSIPSKLLEHVAFRMMKSLFERFKEIKIIKLSILKENPPIVATECAGCGVEIELSRAEMDDYSVF
ncbi:MAG: dihydroneopterin aldolase [Bacteroidaceae bacterium]|jgi:dihydroneopterin aldolase|nr:dihydroneopterin aldolase [Bacteroidaceae bacterium]MBQ2165692.1 dihydroneopterin aldolase [Bacteroidaceae bacterium]MBQ2181556.1 dihydroneopterin aldolase [Bacteroidaceae bacterium]MBQ2200126.1 dihydroneopterin aldolase [Bacteroidaceae bacterium]MBQ2340310.1 dihydroneopterin aldolase [Bacteroidaceae bacterium]